MSPFIYREGGFLLDALLLGLWITFLYDCLLVFRRVVRHGNFWISLEDLFYWIFVSIRIFYLLYDKNDGAFRWFAILGAALGMVCYKKSLSPFYVEYVSRLLLWVKALFHKMFAFFYNAIAPFFEIRW